MSEKPTYEELEKRIQELERAESQRKRTEKALEKRILALTLPLDDAESINFEDLFNLDDIQRLQDEFSSATGVASLITDPDGMPITQPSNFCRLCTGIIQKTDKGLSNCRESDAKLGHLSVEGLIIQPCFGAGLWDACTTVSIGGKHIANWGIGQVRDETQTEEKIRKYAREIGADEEEAVEAFHEVPKMSKDQFGRIAKMLLTLANQLSSSAYQTVQQARFITEINQAREALKESETHLRTLIRTIPDLIWLKDQAGIYLFCNSRFENLFGAKEKDIIGKTDYDFVDKELVDFFRKHDKLAMAKGKPSMNEEEVTFADDGHNEILETIKTPMYGSDGQLTGVLGIGRDITERKRAAEALRESEEKLARSKKMESLGLLAGGVAHDLNNVLSGIVSYPDLLLLDLPEDSKLRKPIETMRESGRTAVAIVQDLLTVARGVATTKEPLNLNDIIGDYLHSPEFKKLEQFYPTIKVKNSFDSDLLHIRGSHTHIRKAVMNLVSNALEAIEGSGHINIATMNRYLDRPIRGYDDVSIGEYSILSVSDDGSGISSDDLERIFEPFYTKKVMGRRGTGLGLAVVWNVVQDHKGYINVTTGEIGTTFELYFPITRDEVSKNDLSLPIKEYKGDGETILVVDDVESQREISCNMLDILGYKTNAVSSGEEAVEYLKENTVDLILLDMIMDPGINGRETYERIIKIHPHQKAIIISGFAQTEDVKEAQKLGAGKYVKKPLTLERIGLAVKEELEK